MEVQRCLLLRILDGADDPMDLPLALLQDITDNFSEERKLGQGGFGVVYKGVLGERTVAVKRIHINEHTVDDRLFRREFVSLWNTSHRNVVRFLGFCSNTHQKTIEDALSGGTILVNVLERLLCFEYISNGSLDKHITDELRGLEWETRYEIIVGICKGLRYLHKEKNIIHMDLKPANILLHHQDDKYLVPKITDFGLSRPNEISHTMGKVHGTRAYMAPEYREGSKTTPMCDIYSLGLIIIELITGCMEVPNKDNVLRRWRRRWSKPPTQLRYQQVTRCMEIAGLCRAEKPEARPSISNIIRFLSEYESTSGPQSNYLDDDMLGIEPLELHYTVHLNKEVSWLVKLTNRTNACFAFKIERPSKQYTIWPDQGVVPSGCNECLVRIKVGAPQVTQNGDKFTVWSTKLSEGLTVERITEHTFHEEDGKVVDEVDLRVVYEPTKPQQNFRSREDTNMLAGEDPEAKKRKMLESSSGKGKNDLGSSENAEVTSLDISSSSRGQCTAQTEQCNMQTPQSFSRHYRTSRRYLGEESHRAVDSTRGAMGSLLDKLGKLVMEDYHLEPRIKKDVESFSEDLRNMHLDLPKLENVYGAKDWVDEVREMSYQIEDMVDCFLVHVEPNSSRSGGFKELKHEGLKLLVNGIPTHDQIDEVIRDIKDKVKAAAERKEKYNINVKDVVANTTVKDDIDPRLWATYIDREQLIGIEEPKEELMRLFKEDGDVLKLKIVSIVGLGGLGKTTLAKAVYEKISAPHYTRAFVPVGRNPDVKEILKNIIKALDNNFNATNLDVMKLQNKVMELLQNKRYFILIDDIWDFKEWNGVRPAFPENKNGSRVMITTRNKFVASLACRGFERKYIHEMKALSEEDSRKLFFRIIYGAEKDCASTQTEEEISVDILRICGGMPLAINCIASLLACDASDSNWEYVRKSLGALTEGNNGLENMTQILELSYIHLPDDLKTCMLYVCKYPEDREIDKNYLLRQWVAEGFVHVSANSRLDAYDVAEKYFQALINMCMIQRGEIEYNSNEVLSCRVHDIILDLMRSKSTAANFIHVIDCLKDMTEARGKIRRVSVQHNDEDDVRNLDTKGPLSHVRSALVYQGSLVPYFLAFKYVRVLHIKDMKFHGFLDLTCINRLFLLRYLKIELSYEGGYLELPDQIGDLQQLETIDLYVHHLKKYPSDIVSLPRLSYLRYHPGGIVLPDGITRLKYLRTLEGVDVARSTADNLKGLGELANLENLQIFTRRETVEGDSTIRMNALQSSISRLSTSLRIFALTVDYQVQAPPTWKLFRQGSHIRKIDLGDSTFQRCPEWIGQLPVLYSLCISVTQVADGLTIVGGLPSLAYFDLTAVGSVEESVVIPGSGAFRALRYLRLDCKRASLTFEAGAMPKLEKLHIEFRHNMTRRLLPVGIQYLPASTLKNIFLDVDDYSSNMDAQCKKWSARRKRDYQNSDEFIDKLRKHIRKLRPMLTRAFKQHHPSADFSIFFEDSIYFKGVDEGDVGVEEEENHVKGDNEVDGDDGVEEEEDFTEYENEEESDDDEGVDEEEDYTEDDNEEDYESDDNEEEDDDKGVDEEEDYTEDDNEEED